MSGRNATATFLIALNADAGVPSEIMVLPAGATIRTLDGRGPYKVVNAERLAAESMAAGGGKLVIDQDHATDLAAPKGLPAPARGWMTGLQARADGIWAPVEWTDTGRGLIADKAYRGVSAVFHHAEDGTITRILRASLTNAPNLRGMPALHAEGLTMNELLKKLLAALDLKDDANEATALQAVAALKSSASLQSIARAAGLKDDADVTAVLAAVQTASTALQAALKPIAKAAGLAEGADAPAILAAVTTLAAGNKDGVTVTALQSELKDVTTKFNALSGSLATERATAFVDGAIKAGRVGVKPLREHYIAMHATDPGRVEKEIGAMPVLGPSGAQVVPPRKDKDGLPALNAEQSAAAKALGIKPEAYAKTLAAEAAIEEVA